MLSVVAPIGSKTQKSSGKQQITIVSYARKTFIKLVTVDSGKSSSTFFDKMFPKLKKILFYNPFFDQV
jgi:hypothetical protein